MAVEDWTYGVDTTRPSPARMYDYFLGGSQSFAADREAAEQVIAAVPNARQIARANRAFLGRAVRYLVDQGIRQFLDLGSGIPTVGNVHEVAQAIEPATRVAYVDMDPIAVAHSVHLLKDNERAAAIRADLRFPDAILNHTVVSELLDLTAPVGLLLISVLHFMSDDEAYPAVDYLRANLPGGSFVALSHAAAEGIPQTRSAAAADVYKRSTTPGGAVRDRTQINAFFGDLHLVPPGLVWASQWGPGAPIDAGEHPDQIAILAGVAHKLPG